MMRKVLDERGALVSYGNKPRVRVIPYKKPSKADSVGELESDNAPRKPLLAARSSGRANPKNQPGRRDALGVTKTEAMDQGPKTMSNNFEYDTDAVIKRAEAAMDAGDFSNAEKLLDIAIEDT